MPFRAPRDVRLKDGTPPAGSLKMNALHVGVLANLALAQPIYDRLGARPAFLLDLGVRPPEVFLLVAVLTLGLPAAMILLECLVWPLGRRWRDAVHAIAVYVLV